MTAKRLMFIAGEASGDTLAAELVKALRQEAGLRGLPASPDCFGAGGPKMAAEGIQLAFDLTTHAVVGIWEALKNYHLFKALFDQLFQWTIERQPHAILLVDYPGFNLRFARAIQRHVRARRGTFNNWNPKIIYYVSPQIWAWHSSRVRQIARDVDLMLTIFPFERAWYAARAPQLRVEFVGHPLVDRYLRAEDAVPGAGAGMPGEGRRGIEGGRRGADLKIDSPGAGREAGPTPGAPPPLGLLLPGSRAREVRQHLPIMLNAAKRIAAQGAIRWRLVLPHADLVELARPMVAAMPALEIQTAGLAAALGEASLAIAASGTVTLECAFFGLPVVVIYRSSWSTYELGKQVIKVKYLAMPNLLAGESIYPELIQSAATPEAIAAQAIDLLCDPTRRAAIRLKLDKVISGLGPPGASRRAAQAVLSLI